MWTGIDRLLAPLLVVGLVTAGAWWMHRAEPVSGPVEAEVPAAAQPAPVATSDGLTLSSDSSDGAIAADYAVLQTQFEHVHASVSALSSALAYDPESMLPDGSAQSAGTAASLSQSLGDASSSADREISRRINVLSALSNDVQDSTLGIDEKQSISDSLSGQIGGLNALKAKIDGETSIRAVASDLAALQASSSDFMLAVPQTRVALSHESSKAAKKLFDQLMPIAQSRVSALSLMREDSASTTLASARESAENAMALSDVAFMETQTLSPAGSEGGTLTDQIALKDAGAKMRESAAEYDAALSGISDLLEALGIQGSSATSTLGSS